jgi:putative ABC transport system permease protein
MSTFLQDLRYGWRKLARSPGFTAVAVLTLALGIGANSAIFSVVNAVLLQPLPYGDPERLVLVWNRMESTGFPKAPVAPPDVVDYRRQTRSFVGFAATDNVSDAALTGDGEPEQIKLASVTANFFDLLQTPPLLGRTFAEPDAAPFPPGLFNDPEAVIPSTALVLSNGLWRRRFGADPTAVGRTLRVNGQPMEVVGVMPPGFELLMPADAGMPTDIDAWAPLRLDLSEGARDQQFLRVIARLRAGVTLEQAQAELDAVAARQREQFQFHRNMGMHVLVVPMHRDVVGHVRPALLALVAAVAFVLLIACANVANLLLARATLRRREMAVRAALGAGRWRIARQVLTEGLLLSLLGGVAGLALARAGLSALLALRPPDLPRVAEIGIDGRVLAFTVGATALAALLFGLAPALSTSLGRAGDALKERAGTGGGLRLRSSLVVVEVALSLLLLVGAGLMLKSFWQLVQVRPGFDPEGVLTYKLSLPFAEYGQAGERIGFFQQLEQRVAGLPGVEAVGAVFPLPLAGRFWTGPYGRVEDPPEEWSKNEASFRVITPGYFRAMGIRQVAGRPFEPADVADRREVAVVDVRMANRLWPGRSPVGERLGIDLFGNALRLEVVGVVESVRHDDLTAEDRETVYLPQHLFPWVPMTVAVRSAGSPAALVGPVRAEVRRLDDGLPVYAVAPMAEYVASARAASRFTLVLIAVFAGAALLLAAVGLFGVISYSVRQRRREIGIRIALGAQRSSILRLIVGRGLLLILLGLALGLAAAPALSRMLSGLLFEVEPSDPGTFAAVATLLVAVAVAASYLPARRATEVDPTESLRPE